MSTTKKTTSSKAKTKVTKTRATKGSAAKTKKTTRKPVAKKAPAKKTASKGNSTSKKTTPFKPKKPLKPKPKNTLPPPKKDDFKLGFPRSISLSVITVSRFPLDLDSLAIGMARCGGMALLIAGTFFTSWHAYSLGFIPTPKDMAASLMMAGSTTPVTADLVDPVQSAPVSINLNQNPDTSLVELTAENAQRVDLVLYRVATKEAFVLGSLSQKTSSKWELDFDASKYPDGQYLFKAVLINDEGSQVHFSDIYDFSNQTEITDGSDSKEDSDIKETTAALDISSGNFLVSLVEPTTTDLSGNITLTAKTSDTPDQIFFKIISEIGDIYTLGRGVSAEAGVYSHEFDTSEFPDGSYYLMVETDFAGDTYRSPKLLVSIDNGTSATVLGGVTQSRSEVVPDAIQDQEEVIYVTPTIESLTKGAQSDIARFLITTNSKVDALDLYVKRLNAEDFTRLGAAHKTKDNNWEFIWDTKQLPNGSYILLPQAFVKDEGFYFGDNYSITIENSARQTVVQREVDNDLRVDEFGAEAIVKRILEEDLLSLARDNLQDRVAVSKLIKTEDIPEAVSSSEISSEEIESTISNLLVDNEETLTDAYQKLMSALRGQDEFLITLALSNLEAIEQNILKADLADEEVSRLVVLENHLKRKIIDLTLRVEASEKVTRERFASKLSLDSDRDGVTDYDEIHLYQTHPNIADSDQDGFVDGIEIFSGHDPLTNDENESLVFGSPKESGLILNDLLKINAITQINSDEKTKPQALISGVGLPNSFVNLYIFSEPMTTTVKTDAAGNWSYVFDQDLEDGKHEVYVGLTDNSGKVIAKSQPSHFIKTAHALTPVIDTTQEATTTQKTTSNQETNSLFMAASAAVAAVGAVLVLIGLYLRTREKAKLQDTASPNSGE